MELPIMPNKYPIKQFLKELDQKNPEQIRKLIHDPDMLKDYDVLNRIWEDARHIHKFKSIDIEADWNSVNSKLGTRLPLHYHKVSVSSYFLKIAALFVLTCGLSLGFYKLILLNKESGSGFTQFFAEEHNREVILPDGSKVTLNKGSHITYRDDFSVKSRDVILNGAAFFNVVSGTDMPFRVYSGESMVEVTGTRFSVYEEEGKIQVSVLSGKVFLCAAENQQNRIAITANQSGYLMSNNELKIEKRIPVNTLSWKTGDLIFDQTPIDTALMDIARHFKRDLSIDVTVGEKITAEFYNQPLDEILHEISLVAGLHFDTTGTALIVRK
jgi:transmembrane sensor